jgi:hypothetical protein
VASKVSRSTDAGAKRRRQAERRRRITGVTHAFAPRGGRRGGPPASLAGGQDTEVDRGVVEEQGEIARGELVALRLEHVE